MNKNAYSSFCIEINKFTATHDMNRGWKKFIKCLKLQVLFRKRATNHRALLRKMTYEDKDSMTLLHPVSLYLQYNTQYTIHNTQYTIHNAQCTMQTAQHAMHNAQHA